MSTDERMKLADALRYSTDLMEDLLPGYIPGSGPYERDDKRREDQIKENRELLAAALRAQEAADAGAVAVRAEGITTPCEPMADGWKQYGMSATPTAAGIAAPPAYVNPVDTHDWEKQLDKNGNWNLNSVCRRCKCELMPAFRGVSVEGTSPCPLPTAPAEPSRDFLEEVVVEIGNCCKALGKTPLEPITDFIRRLAAPPAASADAVRAAALLEHINALPYGWLPGIGRVKNVTFDDTELALVVAALTAPVAGADAGMRAALRPFADAADDLVEGQLDRDHLWESPAAMSLTAGDLRAAKAALSPDAALSQRPNIGGEVAR